MAIRTASVLVALLACLGCTPSGLSVDNIDAFTTTPGTSVSQPLVVRVDGKEVTDFTATLGVTQAFTIERGARPAVTFSPTGVGEYNAVLTVTAAGKTTTVSLLGHATGCGGGEEKFCSSSSACGTTSVVCHVARCFPGSCCGIGPAEDGTDCSKFLVPGSTCHAGVCTAPPMPQCVGTKVPDMPVVWTEPLSGAIVTSDDRVFVSNGTGLRALDGDGHEVWSVAGEPSHLALVGDVLLASATDGLTGRSAVDGHVLWNDPKAPFDPYGFEHARVSDHELVYFGPPDADNTQGLFRFDATDGTSVEVTRLPYFFTAVIGDGAGHLAYVGAGIEVRNADGTSVAKLEADAMQPRAMTPGLVIGGKNQAFSVLEGWHLDGSRPFLLYHRVAEQMVSDGTRVVLLDMDNLSSVESIDVATGTAHAICTFIAASPGEGSTGFLPFLTSRGSVLVLSPGRTTGPAPALTDIGPEGAVAEHDFPSDASELALVGIVSGRALVVDMGHHTLQALQLLPGTTLAPHGWVTPGGDAGWTRSAR